MTGRLLVAAALVFVTRSYPSMTIGAALAAALACAALAVVASRSTAAGPALVAMLAGLYFVPTTLINIPEGVLFGLIDVAAAPVALARELGVSIIAGIAVAAAVGRLRAPPVPLDDVGVPTDSVTGLLRRLVAAVAFFVLCYYVVGAAIYPFVKEYYGSRPIPPPASIVSMQVLRAVALIGALYPAIRTIRSRRAAQWVCAVVLPVLGGLVPLIPENTVMPLPMRVVHGIEIVTYYSAFGLLVATWFGRRQQPSDAVVRIGAPILR